MISPPMIPVLIMLGYMAVLLGLGFASNYFLRKTQVDYFLASRGVGPVLLFMSLFGTTMTAFAMVGSSGESYESGIGVYGLMASWSGIVHSLCFFLIGTKLWAYGKRYGYMTQIQFFRDRFESDKIALVLFPLLVGLMIPYLLVGVIGLGRVITSSSVGAFPEVFAGTNGAIPYPLGTAIICAVVLVYVFFGGVRGTLWVNAFQNALFIIVGMITLFVISDKLGGADNATRMVMERNPSKLKRTLDPADQERYQQQLARYEQAKAAWQTGGEAGPAPKAPVQPHGMSQLYFLSYAFIPLSVGMFPHLFQYYLTAKSARAFKMSVIMHPIFILLCWLPCVMLGVWATSAVLDGQPVVPPGTDPNRVLATFVKKLTGPILGGLMAAGILATNSLDAQFLVLGNMFTNDIVGHYIRRRPLSDRQLMWIGRGFVIFVVLVSYALALRFNVQRVFELGTWCFGGFAALTPLVLAAIYWKRTTKPGAYASVIITAVAWGFMFWHSGFGADPHYEVLHMHPVAPLTIIAALSIFVVSLLTRPPSERTLAKFFPDKSAQLARSGYDAAQPAVAPAAAGVRG